MNLFTVLMFVGVSCTNDWHTICGAKFIENYDADTFKVNLPGHGHEIFTQNLDIRILGIDAPEMDSLDKCEVEKAKEAREYSKLALTKAKKIDLHYVARDKYFRILAIPVLDGMSLAQLLVDAKLAVGYDGGTKQKIDWCTNPPRVKG